MSPKARTVLRVVLGAVALAVVLSAVAAACPLCKDEVPADGSNVWRGMYWSILLMMAMPFTAAATVVALVLRAKRRQQAAGTAVSAPLPLPFARAPRTGSDEARS